MVISPNLDKELVKSSNVGVSQIISTLPHFPYHLLCNFPWVKQQLPLSMVQMKNEIFWANIAHLKIPLTQVVPKFCCILGLPGSLKTLGTKAQVTPHSNYNTMSGSGSQTWELLKILRWLQQVAKFGNQCINHSGRRKTSGRIKMKESKLEGI